MKRAVLTHPVAFIGYGAAVLVILVAPFFIGRLSALPSPQSFSQRDQAVSIIAANIGQTLVIYDVTWDAPLTTTSVTKVTDGLAVVEHVEAGGWVYELRGVVSPTGILVGHIKQLSGYKAKGNAS